MILWCIVLTFVLQLVLLAIAGVVYRILRDSAGGKRPEHYDMQFLSILTKCTHNGESLGRIEEWQRNGETLRVIADKTSSVDRRIEDQGKLITAMAADIEKLKTKTPPV